MHEFQSLADLLDLQEVDLSIDRLLHERSSLPALQQYRAAHVTARNAEKQRDELADRLRQTARELDKAEGELEILEKRLTQEERRLYAGGMSARDTENMRLEVESLKRRRSSDEDVVLELIDAREGLESEVESAERTVADAKAEERRLEAEVAEAWKAIDGELARKESRKVAIVALIPEDLLATYERLRATKEGVAVGRLADGVCGGCHLTLSAAEQVEVLRDDPPRCLHCRRLLVP